MRKPHILWPFTTPKLRPCMNRIRSLQYLWSYRPRLSTPVTTLYSRFEIVLILFTLRVPQSKSFFGQQWKRKRRDLMIIIHITSYGIKSETSNGSSDLRWCTVKFEFNPLQKSSPINLSKTVTWEELLKSVNVTTEIQKELRARFLILER